MKKNRRKKKISKDKKICQHCEHCLAIGEGDFYCDEEDVVVISDYTPLENYLYCNGKNFKQA